MQRPHAIQLVGALLPFSAARMDKHETADEEEEEVDYDYDAQEADIAGADDDGMGLRADLGIQLHTQNSRRSDGPVLLQGTRHLRTSMGICTMRKASVMNCKASTSSR